MKKEEATLTLSGILAEKGKIKIFDSAMLNFCVTNAISAYPIINQHNGVEKKLEYFLETDGSVKYFEDLILVDAVSASEWGGRYSVSGTDAHPNYRKALEELRKNEKELARAIGANYLFISEKTMVSSSYDRISPKGGIHRIINPFALIGEDEVEELKEVLAGDLSEKVAKAAEELGIDISVDYNALLRTNPPEFRRYFKATSEKKQIEVVGGILKLNETINPEIMAWLEENYAPIIRHAGVLGVGK